MKNWGQITEMGKSEMNGVFLELPLLLLMKYISCHHARGSCYWPQ